MSSTKLPAKIRTVAIIENSNIAVMGESSQYAGMLLVCQPKELPKEYKMRALIDCRGPSASSRRFQSDALVRVLVAESVSQTHL